MRTRFCLFIENHLSHDRFFIRFFFLLLFIPLISFAGDVPIDRNFLRLPDQRWVWLEKTGWHTTRITLGRGEKSFKNKIWSQDYETDGERHTWEYAYFVRIKPKHFITFDENRNPQVAISTYDMGNGVVRWAIIYRIKKDRLEIIDEVDGFNVAADVSVYK
jgi:hypothetical protein